MTQKVWIYGASGHGKVILDVLNKSGIPVNGFVDDDENIKEFAGMKVIGPGELPSQPAVVIMAIGENATRKNIVEAKNYSYITAIHPSAIISSDCKIGEGTVVMAGVAIQPGAVIGQHAIINTSVSIDHDCKVGEYVHISPGAILCGNVTIGEGTWIGAGSTIIQGITIGKNTIIGAGSLIREDVPDNVLVAGNPQRIIRKLTIDD